MNEAYHIPEKTEHLDELLEWRRKPMWLPCLDVDSPLHIRAIRTIEDEDRNDGQGQEPTETVEEDANCRVFASSGASSRLNVSRHLSLIHPDTEEISEAYILINIIYLVSMPMNRHRSGWRFFSNPSVTAICVKLLISDAGDTACMGIYLEDQQKALDSSLPPTSHECPSYIYWFEARLKV